LLAPQKSILLRDYLKLMRLDRPVGSLLLLWPTLAALWMAADGLPPWRLLVIFVLGTFAMRSAGCVINDYADRHVDGQVERTRDRPLATGAVKPRQALILAAVLTALAGLLVLFLNRETQLLAVGGLAVAALYPFMKRWTHLPQAVLGVAFSWGILMAWTATGRGLTPAAGLAFIASALWIVAYDTMYAMVDRDDDIRVGVKSTAILFGQLDRLMIGILQLSALLALWLLGQRLGYGIAYQAGLAAIGGLYLYQQFLIRNREREHCFAAFTNNIWVGFALFAATVAEVSLAGWLGA
jgi:4-hydroxybenzoate polyprenyltransferase